MRSKKVKTSKWAFLNKEPNPILPSGVLSLNRSSTSSWASQDQDFYREAWERSKQVCENCGQHLNGFSRSHIAHLLTKKAFPRFRHNFDNYATLCLSCHDVLDARDRTKMKIWPELELRIEKLKFLYYDNKKEK